VTPDPFLDVGGVAGAALLASLAGLLVAAWPRRPTAEAWIRRRTQRRSTHRRLEKAGIRRRLSVSAWGVGAALNHRLPPSVRTAISGQLSRAGIALPLETIVSVSMLLMVALGCLLTALVLDGVLPLNFAVLAAVAVPLVGAAEVGQRAGRRRRAILDQLPILVDLMALEQRGGGVGPRTAIELVVNRLEGDAAMLLRSCLTASATAGTPQLDRQLEMSGTQLDIAALSALAAAVRIQREEGIATSSPLGQLARGLRDRQRDDLLSRGRRALVTMLLPVALCILLPFVLIILYPAIERLSTAFG
jgi:Flp pilus assembly protein TadB